MKSFNLNEYLRLKAEGEEPKICTRSGRIARIICTDADSPDYPIVALCKKDGECESLIRYRNNGKFSGGWENEFDLMFADLEERPSHIFKPFDKVLVRDSLAGEWHARLLEMVDGSKQCRYITTSGGAWLYCIPYEGNEHLLGTTETPKL